MCTILKKIHISIIQRFKRNSGLRSIPESSTSTCTSVFLSPLVQKRFDQFTANKMYISSTNIKGLASNRLMLGPKYRIILLKYFMFMDVLYILKFEQTSLIKSSQYGRVNLDVQKWCLFHFVSRLMWKRFPVYLHTATLYWAWNVERRSGLFPPGFRNMILELS